MGARELQAIAASFPVADGDQIMLVTDGGQIIRTASTTSACAARKTRGVTVFRVGDGRTRGVGDARVRRERR